MFGISEYLMAGSVAVALASGGYGFLQKQQATLAASELNTAKVEILALRGQLMTCGARLQNILDDMESDNEVDNLTDDQLIDVPSHWLLPADPAVPAGH